MKLDAYRLKHDLIWISGVPGEANALLETTIDVLASLGERFRPLDNLCESTIADEIRRTSELFEIESDDALLHANRIDSGDHMLVMEAYYILSGISFLVKPKLCCYFISLWVTYTIRNKVMSKYTPGELFLLCCGLIVQ